MIEHKINIVRSVLDELATVGYISNIRQKRQSLDLIREILNDFTLPIKPIKADITIHSMKLILKSNSKNLDSLLSGLATLSEKALSELVDDIPVTYIEIKGE